MPFFNSHKLSSLVLSLLLLVLVLFTSCKNTPQVQPTPAIDPISTVGPRQPTKVVLLVTSTSVISTAEALPGSSTPIPTKTPSTELQYQYTNRQLQPGDLLIASIDIANKASSVYAASPDNGFTPELVLTLPGMVYQFYVHPDLKGLDFAVSDMVVEEFDVPVFQQLFTLRFDQPDARLIKTFDLEVVRMVWSPDGKYLAFLETKDRNNSGASGGRMISIIDLSCRDTGDCPSTSPQLPAKADPYDLIWSPKDYRLAFTGDSGFGSRDVFAMQVNSDGSISAPVNLSNSPGTEDFFPQWKLDGSGLMFPCSNQNSPNDYSLCETSLEPGEAKEVRRLPENMSNITASPDGSLLFDYYYLKSNQANALRAFNLTTGGVSYVIPKVEVASSPFVSWDNQFVGFIQYDRHAFIVEELAKQQITQISTRENELIYSVQWIK